MIDSGYWPATLPVYEVGQLTLHASVITIGTFDGVHRGHQALVSSAVKKAQELGVPSVVWTFDPPPKVFFGRAQQLTTLERKLELLSCLGADAVVVARFDDVYRRQSAAQFISDLQLLNPLALCVGRDFRFGANQSGDICTLAQRFTVHTIATVCAGGNPVSSTRIRGLVLAGAHAEAAILRGWSRPEMAVTDQEQKHV